jgi:hypothetical protein
MITRMSTRTITQNELVLVKARIDATAPTISTQRLGLVYHRPESWADAARCYENVSTKVAQNGGRMQFGWTFHHRFAADIPDAAYLFLTHHAVWCAPDGSLVNVTPYPEPQHHPFPGPGADFVFLMDDKARPVRSGNVIVPLPLQFFALYGDERLTAYVERLNAEEQERFRLMYAAAGSS